MPSIEPHQITIDGYRDSADLPTCASDFSKGLVCPFFMTQRFCCNETCLFATKDSRYWDTLKRRPGRGGPGLGSLIPHGQCPVWPASPEEPLPVDHATHPR